MLGTTSIESTIDPWGTTYVLACGPTMVPAGVHGVWIISAGRDRRFGTADDIRSDRLD